MHYVSLIIEFLRGRPSVVFWTVALSQAALWTLVPALFYSAPPGDVPLILAIGHEFVLGSYMGPPLAFWLGEITFRIAGSFGLYTLAQACVVTAYWAVFALGRAIVGRRTIAEIAAYEWTPTACPERLLVLPIFTPRSVSLEE